MITGIDHIVLTVNNIEKSIFFYHNVLGMTLKELRPDGKEAIRYSLNFGNQKINLHVILLCFFLFMFFIVLLKNITGPKPAIIIIKAAKEDSSNISSEAY